MESFNYNEWRPQNMKKTEEGVTLTKVEIMENSMHLPSNEARAPQTQCTKAINSLSLCS